MKLLCLKCDCEITIKFHVGAFCCVTCPIIGLLVTDLWEEQTVLVAKCDSNSWTWRNNMERPRLWLLKAWKENSDRFLLSGPKFLIFSLSVKHIGETDSTLYQF